MTHERDLDRLLDAWFADGPLVVADRMIDDVADRIVRERQRPAWRLHSWRDFHMITPVKMAAAVAAVLILGVVGIALVLRPAGSGVGNPSPTSLPSPSATPTAAPSSPSTAPSAGAVFPAWFTAQSESTGAGIVPAGRAVTRAFLPGSSYIVPPGWVNTTDTADYFGLFPDTTANKTEFAVSRNTAQGIFMGIVDTPGGLICEGVETHGATAAELVDSLVANKALVTSARVDVAIGGLTGTRVDARIDPTRAEICPLAPEDPPTKDYKDYRGRFVFLDIPAGGKILIIVDSVHSAGFEGFLADAMPIVESFNFDLAK